MTKEFLVAFQIDKKLSKNDVGDAILNEFPTAKNITVIWENEF